MPCQDIAPEVVESGFHIGKSTVGGPSSFV